MPNPPKHTTINTLHSDFVHGDDSVPALVERNISRVDDPTGEGSRAFLSLDRTAARSAAVVAQCRFTHTIDSSVRPLEGVPIAIKDLFDVRGEVTAAGSTALRHRPAATDDCAAVVRLRAAGAIPFGRSNMVEFAYSGVGINPHFGTPRNVWGRSADGGGRVPGGSTSGGGVAVADGMAVAALGSDTGGSVRIPAALNGICGFKPTAIRVPVTGAIPLSFSLDSIGPLAASVACCARIDAVLSGVDFNAAAAAATDLRGKRLLKPVSGLSTVWNDLDPEVLTACNAALDALAERGAVIVEAPCPALDEYFAAANHLGLTAPERSTGI